MGPDRTASPRATLAALTLVYGASHWSRQLTTYLTDFTSSDPHRHMNVALDISPVEYGIVAGTGYALFFAAASLGAGSVTGRWDPRRVAVVAALCSGASTIAHAGCQSFAQLAAVRAAQGLAQAFNPPTAYPLIAAAFPADRVASVNGIYGSGMYAGGAMASLSVVIAVRWGWRGAILVAGSYEVLTALIAAVVLCTPTTSEVDDTQALTASPPHQDPTIDAPDEPRESSWQALMLILRDGRTRLIFCAAAWRFCAGFTIGVWKAPFVYRKFPDHAASFGALNAAVVTVGGVCASVLGGYAADRLFEGPRRLLVPAIGSIISIPLFAMFVLTSDFREALAWLLVEYVVAEGWVGPTLAAMYDGVPPHARGTAQGAFSALIAIGTLAPIVVGLRVPPNGDPGPVFLAVVAFSLAAAGVLFVSASFPRRPVLASATAAAAFATPTL